MHDLILAQTRPTSARRSTQTLTRTGESVVLPPSPVPDLEVIELNEASTPLLQRFFEENPFYFEAVNGQPAQPGEAHEEIFGQLPSGWPYTKKLVVGYMNHHGRMEAMAHVISDLLAAHVWHIGTFILATELHGTGKAAALYEGLEEWMKSRGARWLRLGVVAGHERAERFWSTRGYSEVKRREGIEMGRKTNTVRVMTKPLYGQALPEYFELVARDRPAPTNAA